MRALKAWDNDQRAVVGPGAVSFLSMVRMQGIPSGWQAFVGHLTARFVSPAGDTIASFQPGRETAIWGTPIEGDPKAVHAFLVPRAQFDAAVAAGAHIELDYSISLLRPTKSFEFAADGSRTSVPGVGYCGTTADPRFLLVSCFVNRMQPALLVSQVVGAPGEPEPLDPPDFRPGILSFLGNADHTGTAPIGTERIHVTTFDDAAHFDRSITAVGLLNGKDCRLAE